VSTVMWSLRVKRCSVSMTRSCQREYYVEWTSRVTDTRVSMKAGHGGGLHRIDNRDEGRRQW
jgi:hypothetical protein